jgi:tetratricopeptide (TPR) repeat protein
MFTNSRKRYVQPCAYSNAANIVLKFEAAKGAYRRVLERDPNHAKVLQQLGWLHHQQSTNYASQEQAIEYLEKSVASGKSCYLF